MENAHAMLSPSGAHRWVPCPGSIVLNRHRPRTSSKYSSEGTAAHELASIALRAFLDYKTVARADAYLDRIIEADGFEFTVDTEMAEEVQKYLDTIHSIRESSGASLLVETELPIDHITGEVGATGKGDAILLTDDEITVSDLKYGKGEWVDPVDNDQLFMYGDGALQLYAALGDFKRVRMIIHMPRLDYVGEWVLTVEEMAERRAVIAAAAERAYEALKPGVDIADFLQPGEKQCRWCESKASCPALARFNAAAIYTAGSIADDSEFPDMTEITDDPHTLLAALTPADLRAIHSLEAAAIGKVLPVVDLIRTWCTAVESQAESLLHAGVNVPGFKLVTGKQGNRSWSDADAAEARLKAARLKFEDMYKSSLISPTEAEKRIAKAKPKVWKSIQDLITRADGKPTVAPLSDNRPAITVKPVIDDFETVPTESDFSDLC